METVIRSQTTRNGHVPVGGGDSPRFRTPIAVGVLFIAFTYALVRYVVFGDTGAAQIPLYVSNKALAAGSVVFLLLAAFTWVRRDRAGSKYWGRWTLHTAAIHAIISTFLLASAYYPALFQGDRLSWTGELSLLAAVGGLYCYLTIGRLSEGLKSRTAFVASAFVAAHLAFYGAAGWFDTASWPGGLPPITLLSFLITCGAVVLYSGAMRRR